MIETAEAKQVCRAASTLLYPELDFEVKQCGKYTGEDFEKILSRIAFDQEFANTGWKTLQVDRDEQVEIMSTAQNSLAKSLLYHLRKLSPDAIDEQFDADILIKDGENVDPCEYETIITEFVTCAVNVIKLQYNFAQ